MATLFSKSGFKTINNSRIKGYEVDVLASKCGYKIIIECKQQQRSRVIVKNILHQWHGKNSIIKANKVVLVISGQTFRPDEYKLARQLDIALIGDDDIHRLNYIMDREKLEHKLHKLVGFNKKLYMKKRLYKIIITTLILILLLLILSKLLGKIFLFVVIYGIISYFIMNQKQVSI